MKRRKFLFAAAAPLAASPLSAAARNEPAQGPAYHFEPEPSAPLAHYGKPTRDGKLALRASGAVYLLAVSGGHAGSSLGMSTSSDGGDSFAPPTPISPEGAAVSSHGENSPSFGFSPGIEAYALWERSAGGELGTELLLSRSPAFGHVWEEPVRVTDKSEPSTNAFSSLGVSPRGEAYAVWLDGRDRAKCPPGTSSVYLGKSSDGGKTVQPNVAVAHGVCPCCRPSIAFGSGGKVHVSWRQVFPGSIRDIGVATSTDGGKTFSEPVRVAADNWKIDGCPHSGASMVVKGDRLWIGWYSDGEGSNSGVRLSYSDDGGLSFAPAKIVSAEILDANHPDLTVADDGRVLMVFKGRAAGQQDGWAPSGAWVLEAFDDGSTTKPQLVPGHQSSISYPRIVGGTLGRVFVAWTEKGEKGQTQIRLSRGRRQSA
ncbi:MAG: hypothetical protein GC160_25820 [Acidobacteria bacterium]|nr:hypothetical protein [Acidobacteriota bacterium]